MTNIINRQIPPNLSNIYDEKFANQLASTQGAVSSLDQMVRQLHNPSLLSRPLLGKEAESSSQLEGTQASIEDVYKQEIEEQNPEKVDDIREIVNYQTAMYKGLDVLKKGSPLNEVVIRGVHRTLLEGVRGRDKQPGKYRTKEVWIGKLGTGKGEARYIPPEAIQVPLLMEKLQRLIHNRGTLNPLVACGIIHHTFEAIHPFADGNGRTGRLLISMYLIDQGLMTLPVLYPSGYFEKNRDEYTDCLHGVDEKDDWYGWLMFFLKGIEVQSKLALKVGLDIDSLFKQYKIIVEKEKRISMSLFRVLEYSFSNPYLSAPLIVKRLEIPKATAVRYLNYLAEKGILKPGGTFRRQSIFVNDGLLKILKNI